MVKENYPLLVCVGELKVRDPVTKTILIPSDYEEFYRVIKAIISYQRRDHLGRFEENGKYYPLEPKTI